MTVNDITKSLCQQLLDLYKENIKQTNHNASGNLINSATYSFTFENGIFELYFNLPYYWKYLENGTKPHFPPIDAIRKWIEVKPVIPRAINNHIPTTKQLAFLIARKISKVGTPATHILNNTINGKQTDVIIDNIVEELEKQLEEQINNEIDE